MVLVTLKLGALQHFHFSPISDNAAAIKAALVDVASKYDCFSKTHGEKKMNEAIAQHLETGKALNDFSTTLDVTGNYCFEPLSIQSCEKIESSEVAEWLMQRVKNGLIKAS
mgnify:CR=1 FL=1